MKLTLKPLNEQVIVITGASSGIGLVTARAAAAKGAKVVLVSRSDDQLRTLVAEITAAGGVADSFAADVGDAEAVKAAAAHAVERFGRIDTWVNNAGVTIYAKLMDTPNDEHERLFRTDYFGAVNGALAAVPHLKGGGALITVASIVSDMPSPQMGAYAAAKHAVKAYMQSLRMELHNDGVPIAVTLVKPSGIDTPIGQHATNHVRGEGQIPPPPYDPKLVADAILFCAEHPKRDITVGGAGRAQVLFATHFPALLERLAPKAAAAFTDPTKRQPKPSNLFEGGIRTGQERSGEIPARQSSLYTAASKHPRTVAAISTGLTASAIALLLMKSRRQS